MDVLRFPVASTWVYLNMENVLGKKACYVLRPFRIRHYLYNGCPCTYGEGCAALDADVDDGGDDDDGNDADVDE